MTATSENPAGSTALASAAPMHPPYVYLTYPRDDETVAGLLAAELERRGVALTRHVSDPGTPLFDSDDPALGGATAVLLAGGPAIADDDSVESVLPYFPARIFAVALLRHGTRFKLRWPGVDTWAFGDWPGEPDNPRLDDVAHTLLGILGTNAVQRSSSAHAVLAQAAGRSSSPNAATAVLLAALAYTPTNGGTGTALRDLLARKQGLSDRDIIDRIGSLPESAERQDADLRQGFDALLDLASSCASRVSAASTVHLRHLLAAAVIADNPPLDDAVLAELGTDAMGMRALLLDAVSDVRTGDSLQAWEELLAERLAGGFVPDLVDQTLPISRERDDLGQGTWVAMFASLIADETTPMPVSIGLFGEWGAGKSTFMGLLRGEIDRLCGQPGYVRDVMQIGFDAWHYADTNLWASIGDEVFPALMRQLTPPDDKQEAVKQRAAELRDKITAGLVTSRELEGHAEQAQRQTQRLAAEVRKAQEDQVTAWGLLGAALKSSPLRSELRSELDKAWRRLGIQDQVTQGELFAEQLDGIRQDRRALRALLGQRLTWAIAAVCLVALLVTLAGAVIPVSWAGQLRDSGAITTITLVLGGWLTLARRVSAGMAALRSGAAEAAREKDQAIQAARDKLRDAEARQQAAEAELRLVSAGIAQLQRELAGLTPGQRLYAFLAERSASTDYSGQLGIISTIRKDFQHLVSVLKEHRATADAADPRIDRIVLYIDDLDRCRPRQVVDVLQAVHLLLALDLFVVVVGVDPRWLVRSLREQYPGILDSEPGHATAADRDLAEAIPSDYLQKIFNIPFALPAFRSDRMERLVLRMAGQRNVTTINAPVTKASTGDDAPVLAAEPGSQVEAIQAARSTTSAGTAIGPRPQHLTPSELEFLGGLGPFIRTPRDAKRLLNIYRMLRATRDLSPASRFLEGEYQAVAMLLAMLTLDPHVLRQALDAPARPDARPTGGLTRQTSGSVTWVAFAEMIQPAQVGDTWRNKVVGEIKPAELPDWQRMAQAVNSTKDMVKLKDLTAFCEWAPRVRHFSYTLGTQDTGTPGSP